MKIFIYVAVVLIILLLILSGTLMTFFPEENSSIVSLGESILSSGIVSGAFLVIQSMIFVAQKKQTQIKLLRQQLAASSDISGIVLTKQNLKGIYIPNKIATAAQMNEVNLTDAVCTFSDMRFANFEKTIFVNSDLRGANMMHANLTNAKLVGGRFDDVDASNGDWTKIDAKNIVFRGVNFSQVNFEGAKFSGVEFDDCILDGAKFSKNTDGFELKNVQYNESTVWPENLVPPVSVKAKFIDYKGLTLPEYLEKKKELNLEAGT